jgi:hypothetical protein
MTIQVFLHSSGGRLREQEAESVPQDSSVTAGLALLLALRSCLCLPAIAGVLQADHLRLEETWREIHD